MNKRLNILTTAALFLSTAAVVFISCNKDDDPDPVMVANNIELVSGGSQTAITEEALENKIEVIVKDKEGAAFAGEVVKFTVTEGSVSAATVTTNASGKASVTWTLGATEGTQTLTITSTSTLTGSPISVSATAYRAVATSIELVSGNSQTGFTEESLENKVEVLVKDQEGAAFVGEVVNFDVSEGSVSEATVTTNSSGKASVTWTLGATEGTQILTITGTSTLTGSPISVNATATKYTPVIGEFYRGGVVFYIDASGTSGLICAVTFQSSGAEWGCNGTDLTDAVGRAIGTGAQNTLDIEAECTTAGTAADLCANLSLNGYEDWFLPSQDELNEIYLNQATINATVAAYGGLPIVPTIYWSSSQTNSGWAQLQNFDAGWQTSGEKDVPHFVRAIRAF